MSLNSLNVPNLNKWAYDGGFYTYVTHAQEYAVKAYQENKDKLGIELRLRVTTLVDNSKLRNCYVDLDPFKYCTDEVEQWAITVPFPYSCFASERLKFYNKNRIRLNGNIHFIPFTAVYEVSYINEEGKTGYRYTRSIEEAKTKSQVKVGIYVCDDKHDELDTVLVDISDPFKYPLKEIEHLVINKKLPFYAWGVLPVRQNVRVIPGSAFYVYGKF